MKRKLIILLFFITLFNFSHGQTKENKDVYQIISVVIENLNPEIPILDTLNPFSIQVKYEIKQIEEKVSLTRKQKKILKKGEKNKIGILIDRNELPHLKFYDNDSIIAAFKNFDKENGEYIHKKKPFYIIQKPLIFEESGIAILNLDLIGRLGVIYILKKENEKWKIIGEIGKWYA